MFWGALKDLRATIRRELTLRAEQVFYLTPDPIRPGVKITSEAQENLRELRGKGITSLRGKFRKTAEHLSKAYVEPIEKLLDDGSVSSENAYIANLEMPFPQCQYKAKMSFEDPGLAEFLFSPDLIGVAYNYFRRQVYYRNYPELLKTQVDQTEGQCHMTSKFHLDWGLRQVTCMLLLRDLTPEDTHLEYAIGSHRTRHPAVHIRDRFSYSDDRVQDEYEIFKATGKAGDLFVFDAGLGFHRAVYKMGTARTHVHLIFTTGHKMTIDRYDSKTDWPALGEYSTHIRRTTDKITAS